MEIGRLNRLVLIKVPPTGQDAAGQPSGDWTNLITTGDGKVWANIRHLSGTETIRSDQPTSAVKASIRIRYRTDVTAAMRVHHGDLVYEVKAVQQDEAERKHTDLVCELVTEGA